MSRRDLSAAALALLGLSACAGPFGLDGADAARPDVSLAGLRFSEPGLFEQALTIQLRFRNPNEFDIPVDGLNFALDVNDEAFAQGWSRDNFTLPGLGEIVVPVEIVVPTGDLIERVAAVGTGRRLDYRLSGEADIGRWFATTVPFLREGRLALPDLPGLEDSGPAS
jgi:LEA14-like dessication related protein